jgi:hypothetical protein
MLLRFSVLSILVLLGSPVEAKLGNIHNSFNDFQIKDVEYEAMPSLFGPQEAQYDRYAACLAATEGLRRLRDRQLGKRGLIFGKGGPTEQQKRITAEYVVNSSKVLESMGMSVSQFNQLGRQVGNDPELKEKVRQSVLWKGSFSMFVV